MAKRNGRSARAGRWPGATRPNPRLPALDHRQRCPFGASDHGGAFGVLAFGQDQTQIAAVVSPEELRLRRWSAEPGSGVAWRPGESNPVSGSLEAGKNQTTSPPVHPHHFVEFDKPSAITQPSRSILDHSSQDERSCKFAPSETHCLRAL